MKKKAVTLLFVLLFTLTACKGKEAERVNTEPRVVTGVKTSLPIVRTSIEYYETTGTVRAKNTSMVAAKLMGTVEAIYVKEGQLVKKGDVLLKIYSPEINAKVQQAREAVEEAQRAVAMAKRQKDFAETTYKRFEALYKDNAISKQEFDEIKTKRDLAVLQVQRAKKALLRAKAALKEALAYKEYLTVKAPQSGRIAEKKIDIGTMTAPGMPLFILEEPVYQVVFSVDESLIGKLHKGKKVNITISSIGYSGTVKITEVVPSVDPMSRTFNVKADIPKLEGLQGGLYAEVKVPVGQMKRMFVPASALFHWGALEAVYVVRKDRTVELRLVRTGKKQGALVEILSGLEPHEQIVVEGLERVSDGVKLK